MAVTAVTSDSKYGIIAGEFKVLAIFFPYDHVFTDLGDFYIGDTGNLTVFNSLHHAVFTGRAHIDADRAAHFKNSRRCKAGFNK